MEVAGGLSGATAGIERCDLIQPSEASGRPLISWTSPDSEAGDSDPSNHVSCERVGMEPHQSDDQSNENCTSRSSQWRFLSLLPNQQQHRQQHHGVVRQGSRINDQRQQDPERETPYRCGIQTID